MDRCVAVYNNKKYKAYAERVRGQITNIKLFLHRNESGFTSVMSAYDKDLHEKKVKKEEVSELYREYFIASYKNYEFYVISYFKDDNEIEIITADANIGRKCNFDYQDRDRFTKSLSPNDDYQLIYVKEDYLRNTMTRKEVALEELYAIDNEKFE